MPSKLQHEVDKLRGEVSDTGKLYTSSIAALKDSLTAAELSIEALKSEDAVLLTKTNLALSASNRALKNALGSLRATGGWLKGSLLPDKTNTWNLGHSNYYWASVYAKYLEAITGIKTDAIDEYTLHSGVTIDGMLCKDGLIDGLDPSGVEAGATTDQTDAEIKTAIENATDITINANLTLNQHGFYRRDGDIDTTKLHVNYVGYNGGTSRFRDFVVCDGKNANVLYVDGSNKQITFFGDIITTHNVDGRDISVDGMALDGTIRRLQGWITHNDASASLGIIPADSYVIRTQIHVTEAFNGSGIDSLYIGITADNDCFGTAITPDPTGIYDPPAGCLMGYISTQKDTNVYYWDQNSDSNAGKALVIVEYILVDTKP